MPAIDSLKFSNKHNNGTKMAREKQLNPIRSPQNAASVASKIPQPTTKLTRTENQQKEQQNVQQLSNEIGGIKSEMNNMKKTFANFQQSIQLTLDSIQTKITEKSHEFMMVTESLKHEIDSMKCNFQSNNMIQKEVYIPSMATRFMHILSSTGMIQLKDVYITQLENLQRKVTQIENANKRTEEMVNDMATTIATTMGANANKTVEHQQNNISDKIAATENAIECIQNEMDRLLVSSNQDGEKIIRMNKQIHVLSAKYVDFNIKINKYLNDFNRINIDKLYPKNIIDDDAKPYMPMVESVSSDKTKTSVRGQPVPVKMASRPFTKPYDLHEYARSIVVDIRELNTTDLKHYNHTFKQQFSTYIGKNIVKNTTVTGYRVKNDIITSIRYVVEFEIPLNYQYIDNHKFPTNWFFYHMHTNKYHNKNTTKKHRNRQQR